MLFDGPDAFPNSSWEYVRFAYYELREFFAKLRHEEALMQKTLEQAPAEFKEKILPALEQQDWFVYLRSHFKLQACEEQLGWLIANVSPEARDKEPYIPQKRRKPRIKKQMSLFELLGDQGEEDEVLEEDFMDQDFEDFPGDDNG